MSNWQFLISENVNMKVIDVLVEVPCFKCLFVEPIRESHLHCNPNECEKLTDWLLLQVKNDGKAEETVKFTIVHAHTQS
jgi:hypothetical protein